MKIKINALFFVFWAVFAFMGDTELILYIFIAAAIHEAAHICAYGACGAELSSIELLPFGISATVKNAALLPCKKEIICAAAGPVANLILALATYFIPPDIVSGVDFLCYCSIALFAVNILPALPLDGGRILWFALLSSFSFTTAKRVSVTVSAVVCAFLTLVGVYLTYISGNISVLIIAVYLTLYLIIKNKS